MKGHNVRLDIGRSSSTFSAVMEGAGGNGTRSRERSVKLKSNAAG